MPDPPSIGFPSLLPVLIALFIAVWNRQVIFALFLGILTGSVVLFFHTGNGADLNPVTRFVIPSLGTESFAKVMILYVWSLGGLLGVWNATRAPQHFAERVGRKLVGRPQAALSFSWFMGGIFHQGGTMSTVLASTSTRPLTDRSRVSHEELSCVVDATASPMATIIPFNAWPAYIGTCVAGCLPIFPDHQSGIEFFYRAYPFNFYALLILALSLLLALGKPVAIGKRLRAAIRRAREQGALDSERSAPLGVSAAKASDDEGSYTPSLFDFLGPLLTLLGIAIIPSLFGLGVRLEEAFIAAVVLAMILARCRGLSFKATMGAFLNGCRDLTAVGMIIGLSITLGQVSKDLGAAHTVIEIADGLPALVLPAVLTLICMTIAFATGSSWSTFAVVLPLALPLAHALEPNPTYLAICGGAVLGGAVFGDQCSPISDTTILASTFSGCDLMDHVLTQLPMALTAAAVGAGLSTVATAFLV